MASLTSDGFWRGTFEPPLTKHRYHPNERHPEHLPDHIRIMEVIQLDDDEIKAYDEDFQSEYSYEMLTQLGDGPIQYLVSVGFEPVGEKLYDYVIWMDKIDEDNPEAQYQHMREMIAGILQPKA